MFSGLIGIRGTLLEAKDDAGGRRFVIAAPDAVREGIEPKDSIAVDGVCLTATHVEADRIAFDVVPETLQRSTLGAMSVGVQCNIELSLRVGDRIGGHFVYGHVDATSRILAKDVEGQGYRVTCETPSSLARYIVEKGYVTLDGVSLTVASVRANAFTIAMIPETAARTTLGEKKAGDRVNLEIDPLARYAVAALGAIDDSRHEADVQWAYEI